MQELKETKTAEKNATAEHLKAQPAEKLEQLGTPKIIEKPKKKSTYEILSAINVKPFLEEKKTKKFSLSYLSWAKAWGLAKNYFPKLDYDYTEFPEYEQDKDGRWYATGRDVDYRKTSAGVEVEATVYGFDDPKEMYSSKLFVMDYKNQPVMNPTIAEINKTQQRALVKALAYAGLGLDVYAGEDLPSAEDMEKSNLASYKLIWEGKQVTMGQVVTAVSKNNANAKKFASTFKGKDLEVFTKLSNLM